MENLRGTHGALVVVCTCALVLSPMLFIGFLNDDIAFVQFSMKGEWPHPEQLATRAELYSGIYYRPATSVSFMADFLLWGWNAFGFRLTNLAIHLLNTVFVFFLARRLFPSDLPVILSALFFGLHPLHETSLFWLPGRTDVLCAFFFLMSILAFISYYKSRRLGTFVLSVASAGAAFLSKEMAISLPVIIGLVAYYLGAQAGKRRLLTSAAYMLPSLSIIASILLLRIILLDNNLFFDNNPVHSNVSPAHVIKNLASSIGLLSIPFGHYQIEQILSSSPMLFFTLAVLVLGFAIVTVLRVHKEAPQLFFSLLFLLITLVPIGRLTMRWYLYIPSIGFCLGLAWGVEWVSRRSRIALAASIGLLLVYATVLVVNSAGWTRNGRLATDLIQDVLHKVDLIEDKAISFLVIPSRTGTIPLFQLGFPQMVQHELRTSIPVIIFSKVVLDEYPGTVRTAFDSTSGAWIVSIERGGYFMLDNPSFISKRQAASPGLRFIEPEAEVTILSLTPSGRPNALSIRPLISTAKGSLVSFDGEQFVKLSGSASSP